MQKKSLFQHVLGYWGWRREQASGSAGHPEDIRQLLLQAHESRAGIPINQESSMRIAAVNAAVKIISETLASLPLKVFRRLPDGGKAEAPEHHLWNVLHNAPNEWQTSFEYREQQQGGLLLRGDSFAFMNTVGGRVMELLPIHPDRVVDIKQARDHKITYLIRLNRERSISSPDVGGGQVREFGQERIHQIRGFGFNGLTGRSVIREARDSFGLASAQELFGSRLYKRGAQFSGTLTHPTTAGKEARENMEKSWNETYGGSGNSQGILILEEGVKYEKISMTAEDAQFLEARRFQIAEIARMFRIPLHMLQELGRSTNSNIEQQAREFVMHTIRPWLVRWEQAMQRDLFKGDREHFAEFNVEGLLRGDMASRFKAYQSALTSGWMSRNEIRKRENLNVIEGADKLLEPENMRPIGEQPEEEEEPTPAPQPAEPVEQED